MSNPKLRQNTGEPQVHHFLDMDRRSLLGRMAALIGATAAAGLSPSALAKAAAGTRRYLDAPTYALLQSVADTIVPRTDTPGAIDAGVPATIDALLVNWASGERRYALSQALRAIDTRARTETGRDFAALDADTRATLLTAHDAAALKPLPGKVKGTGIAALRAGPPVADPAYAKLKELIVLAYYMSEPALTHELSYVHAPGEWKPSIPVTPDTRPEGGGSF